jgi:sugar-specific transcriptional regulator TrmB
MDSHKRHLPERHNGSVDCELRSGAPLVPLSHGVGDSSECAMSDESAGVPSGIYPKNWKNPLRFAAKVCNSLAMSESAAAEALLELGFSLNEARAYGALIEEHPATGYEVAARAQIPRSAVYGALRRLVKAGAARAIAGSPERFVPTPAEEVMDLLRKRFESSANKFERAIREIDVSPQVPDAYTVRGYRRVMEEAERVVQRATHKLILSGWPREIGHLSPELRRAVKQRKLYLVVFSHAELPDLPGHVFSYGLHEPELETFWQHRLIVVADDILTLIGAAEMTDRDDAVISETRGIAEVATSHVALDITLLSQRQKNNVEPVMAAMLGQRVGRLDSLLAPAPPLKVAGASNAKGRSKAK